jgi:hypothetical protein
MPTRTPRTSPAFAPPDMPWDESAEAAAEMVAEAEARVAAALARDGVGALVATIRVLSWALDPSSDLCVDEGEIETLTELCAGLLVGFASSPLVVLGGIERCAGGPKVTLGLSSSSGPT